MNPVVPRLFSTGAPPPNAAFTTVMNWQAHETIGFNGIQYGQKDIEFQKFETLPSFVDVAMEIAVAGRGVPRERLSSRGWRLRDAHNVTRSVDFLIWTDIHSSLGEFAVCKNVFVATNSGWFSDRSGADPASGRPVVVQATGFDLSTLRQGALRSPRPSRRRSSDLIDCDGLFPPQPSRAQDRVGVPRRKDRAREISR